MWVMNNMSNIKLKNSIWSLVIISALVWFILAWFSGLNLSDAKVFFKLVPNVVSLDLLIITVFTKWLWKYDCFRGWLVPFPNLNGSWIGHIFSGWEDPETGQGVPPIPVMLTINQSFLHISCMMHTGEMKSYSMSEGFNIDKDRQIKQVSYIYTSKPRIVVDNRSLPHDGAIVFDIIEVQEKKLTGRYWTERKTTGEIELVFHTKKILEEIPESIGTHPLNPPRKIIAKSGKFVPKKHNQIKN